MNPYPLRFRPVLKQTIWGGRRLGEQLGKPIGPDDNYAESWEVVDHGADQSIVDNGPLAGQSLADVLAEHPNWLLGGAAGVASFPLLLKYLDCNRVLSVQVHPDDAYAAKMEPPDRGKTEAWYIVSADPGSLIYAGLQQDVNRSMLQEAIAAGQTEHVLHAFHPQPGEIVFIPAGTIHALGAGLVVAEIQQSSDTTFRLFDWNRIDAEGNARPLHLQEALEVADYEAGPVKPFRCDPTVGGWQTAVDCSKFLLRLSQHGTASIGGDNKFHILTVPRGAATLQYGEWTETLRTGESRLLPAAMENCQVTVAENSAAMATCLPDA